MISAQSSHGSSVVIIIIIIISSEQEMSKAKSVKILTVSQAAFDDLVQENIREFDMSLDDAIEDAVSQLRSQGVDLSTIVTKPAVKTDGR